MSAFDSKEKKMKKILLVAAFTFICSIIHAEEKPTITLAKDGFPAGQNSPEGAACDLSRAFMNSDVELLKRTCLKKCGGGEVGKKYEAFLQKIIKGTEEDKKRKTPHPRNPKKIGKVFAARHLRLNGPASYGYAAYNFQDVMFVDIGAFLNDGSTFLSRTLVVKKKDGKWYVHPCPVIDSLLSAGLNDEKGSKADFKDKYKIEKKSNEAALLDQQSAPRKAGK
jgi:hypothetical protein